MTLQKNTEMVDNANLSNLVTTSEITVTSAGGYTIHTFTSSGTFQVVGGTMGVDYMVLADKRGGGGSTRFENGWCWWNGCHN